MHFDKEGNKSRMYGNNWRDVQKRKIMLRLIILVIIGTSAIECTKLLGGYRHADSLLEMLPWHRAQPLLEQGTTELVLEHQHDYKYLYWVKKGPDIYGETSRLTKEKVQTLCKVCL